MMAKKKVEGKLTMAYLRVSTDKQVVARQRGLIEGWERFSGEHVDKWFEEDEAVSGRASAVKGAAAARGDDLRYYAALCDGDYLRMERTGFLDVLRAIEDGGYGRLVVASLDRLSRDTIELLLLERILRFRDCALVVADSGGVIDATSTAGWLLYVAKSAQAELEVRTISERTRDGLKSKKGNGVLIGRPPAGWQKSRDGEWYEPDPHQWPTMLRLVALKHEGATNVEAGEILGMPEGRVRRWLSSWKGRNDEFRRLGPNDEDFSTFLTNGKTETGRFSTIPGIGADSGGGSGEEDTKGEGD